jgi:hypothetical protein
MPVNNEQLLELERLCNGDVSDVAFERKWSAHMDAAMKVCAHLCATHSALNRHSPPTPTSRSSTYCSCMVVDARAQVRTCATYAQIVAVRAHANRIVSKLVVDLAGDEHELNTCSMKTLLVLVYCALCALFLQLCMRLYPQYCTAHTVRVQHTVDMQCARAIAASTDYTDERMRLVAELLVAATAIGPGRCPPAHQWRAQHSRRQTCATH